MIVAVAHLKECLVCQVRPSGVGRRLIQSHRASKCFIWSSDPASSAFLVEGVRGKVGEVRKSEMEAAEEGDKPLGSLGVFCICIQQNKRITVHLCRYFLSPLVSRHMPHLCVQKLLDDGGPCLDPWLHWTEMLCEEYMCFCDTLVWTLFGRGLLISEALAVSPSLIPWCLRATGC